MEPPSPYRLSFRGFPSGGSSQVRARARARLKRLLLHVLAAEHAPAGTLHLQFVSDRVMRRVNASYRGKDKTTDVLSFAYWNEPHAGDLLGEVLVSAAVARTQAREEGRPFEEEVARLALHGLLHVLGHDHETTRERRRMLALQERYLARAWASPPPASPQPPRRAARPRSLAPC